MIHKQSRSKHTSDLSVQDSETSDLVFLTAPPIGDSGGGLLTVQGQH